jgi:hypothetical protein
VKILVFYRSLHWSFSGSIESILIIASTSLRVSSPGPVEQNLTTVSSPLAMVQRTARTTGSSGTPTVPAGVKTATSGWSVTPRKPQADVASPCRLPIPSRQEAQRRHLPPHHHPSSVTGPTAAPRARPAAASTSGTRSATPGDAAHSRVLPAAMIATAAALYPVCNVRQGTCLAVIKTISVCSLQYGYDIM